MSVEVLADGPRPELRGEEGPDRLDDVGPCTVLHEVPVGGQLRVVEC